MGERTPFAQRVDEDLQEFVEFVDCNTNLSKADVMDEALRRLRENSRITDDGQFIVDGDYGAAASDAGEITSEDLHENQQRILQLLGGTRSGEETSVPNKNSEAWEDPNVGDTHLVETAPLNVSAGKPTETEQQIAAIVGEYDHNCCLDPDEVAEIDFQASDQVAHTRRYLLPAAVGMINHELDQMTLREPVAWSEIKGLIQRNLGVARSTVYNYRDALVVEGSLNPHPSIDKAVVGEERVAEARRYAAAVTKRCNPRQIDLSELPGYERERYVDDPDEYLGRFVEDWDREEYFVTQARYREEVWKIIQESIREIATTGKPSGRRPNHDETEMYDAERAAGASRMLVGLINEFGVAINGLHDARSEAVKGSPEQGLEEWADIWADAQTQVEAELFDLDRDEEEACRIFREVVGVDPDSMSAEELRDEYKAWVVDNHPDTGGDEEVAPRDFNRVVNARRALLG